MEDHKTFEISDLCGCTEPSHEQLGDMHNALAMHIQMPCKIML